MAFPRNGQDHIRQRCLCQSNSTYGYVQPQVTYPLVLTSAFYCPGFRTNASTTSFEHILPEDLELTLKAAAEISMGTEISDSDIGHIHQLCDQVISISQYRTQLSEYLRNRMNAIAPNLTALVGELVGARLISHAGSLLSLAKYPASTVQILGAEKALFRALKTKHDTPKYGLIYHASLIGQAPQKMKGKVSAKICSKMIVSHLAMFLQMARMVATKAALSTRVDALTDADGKSEESASAIGVENRMKLEKRLRDLEHQAEFGTVRRMGGDNKRQSKFEMTGSTKTYNTGADVLMDDAEEFASTQREAAAVEKAVKAVLDVKEEKKKKKDAKKAEKKKAKSKDSDHESEPEAPPSKKEKKDKEEKKRKRRESALDAMQVDEPAAKEETEEERKAKKKAERAAKKAAEAEAPKKKKKKTESS